MFVESHPGPNPCSAILQDLDEAKWVDEPKCGDWKQLFLGNSEFQYQFVLPRFFGRVETRNGKNMKWEDPPKWTFEC